MHECIYVYGLYTFGVTFILVFSEVGLRRGFVLLEGREKERKGVGRTFMSGCGEF